MNTNDNEYLESKVLTATPHQLHLMVVDGAIRHTVAGEHALQQRRFDAAHTSFDQAGQFVAELIAGLEPTRTPELVESLKSLFVFVYRTLIQADVDHDPTRAADAAKILHLHRGNWLALGEKLKQEAITEHPRSNAGFSWST